MRKNLGRNILLLLALVGFMGIILVANSNSSDTTATVNKDFVTVDISSAMSKGDKNAKVSVIQYSDFLCPSCSFFSTQIMPAIEKDFISTGKVKFEFRPMAFIAEGSSLAGMGAYCAIDQDKFWPYHDAIYGYVVNKIFVDRLNPKTDVILTADIVKQLALTAGVDAGSFNACLDARTYQSKIASSTETANNNGVTGTPYIMINGQHYQGDMTQAAIEALIQSQL